jgi:hypothetical protein
MEEALPKGAVAVVASTRVGLPWAQTVRLSIAEKARLKILGLPGDPYIAAALSDATFTPKGPYQ